MRLMSFDALSEQRTGPIAVYEGEILDIWTTLAKSENIKVEDGAMLLVVLEASVPPGSSQTCSKWNLV